MGLYGRPRPVPCAPMWRNALTPPPPGDHKGLVKIPRIFLALPHIIRPRPYESSGLLSLFQAEVDASYRRFIGLCRLFRSPDEFVKPHNRLSTV